MMQILHKVTKAVLREVPGDTLQGADLRDVDLRGANLRGANLRDADLRGANLEGANLRDANLQDANLWGADLEKANLRGANLWRADLRGADLRGATMPDGRKWEAYRADHLAGICDLPEVREKAIAAWGKHAWSNCPMHAAFNIREPRDLQMAAWVALYDARLLERPL